MPKMRRRISEQPLTEYDLEAVYDAEIAPLMTQIIAICERVNMPVVASFSYRRDAAGEYDLCSTAIGSTDRTPPTFQRIVVLLVGQD